MRRDLWLAPLALSVLLAATGCGKSTPTADSQSPPGDSSAPTASAIHTPAGQPSPTDVVSEFLDCLRRGSAEADAGRLLTEVAQAECRRTGLVVQPIGSPDARFEVTRSEAVPGHDDAALVHSLWTEPSEGGEAAATYEVVWALSHEEAGWRISGMILQLDPSAPPLMVDFENGDDVLAKLQPPAEPAEETAAPQQAQLPPSSFDLPASR